MAVANGGAKQTADEYAGHSRFTIELEFVQALSNPHYLQHLALQKYLDNPEFIAYLKYLNYWSEPKYLKFLRYPGPTLRVLELVQSERFRKEIVSPEVVQAMINGGWTGAEVKV